MTTYSKSLDFQETVFAELCLETSDIVLDEPHVIDIISGVTSNWDTTNSNYTVKITQSNFVRMFYGVNQDLDSPNPNFDTGFQLTGSGDVAEQYYRLDKGYQEMDASGCDTSAVNNVYSIMGGDGEPMSTGTDKAGVTLNLIDPVTDYWAKDTGFNIDCWSTCSYMSIAKEIDAAHDLTNLDCNVCCSLCYGELLALLDNKQPTRDSVGLGVKRTQVVDGDKVGLRILFKNAKEGTKNVEARIHFEICA